VSRILHVDEGTLKTWHAVLEDESVPVAQTRMVYTVNRATAAVLDKLAAAPRVGSLGLKFSAGWHEKNDRTKGYFDSEWGVPESWDSVILQGPHLHVGTPFYKSPNPTMASNKDWTAVDLEALPPDAVPATQYKPRGDRDAYDAAYGRWEGSSTPTSARLSYRIAWRTMAANTGERTLMPGLIPPGAAHIHRVSSVGSPAFEAKSTAVVLAFLSSMVCDFLVRAVPKSDILMSTLSRLPVVMDSPLRGELIARIARLNCLTSAYARFWSEATDTDWTASVPLRRADERRYALVEIDAIVAITLGISIDELIAIYRTQFPVLRGYDADEYLFDASGRIVPTEVRQAWKAARQPADVASFPENLRAVRHPESGRTHTYELPFRHLDRESDLRRAYSGFLVVSANSA